MIKNREEEKLEFFGEILNKCYPITDRESEG